MSHNDLIWHLGKVSDIRAYRINWSDESAMETIVLNNGSLNPSREPIDGISLNSFQVAQLHRVVYGQHPEHPVAACFYPHHAFLFLNEQGEVNGSIDVCFLCANYSGSPLGFKPIWDLDLLGDLIADLGFDLSNPDWQIN